MGPIGLPEMMALFVIALLLFGPKKLPELGRTLGKGLSEFRRAKSELTATLQSHMNEIERETRIDVPALTDSSTHYSYPYEDSNHYNSDAPASSDREPTPDQHAAIEANAAAADPAAHGVPPAPAEAVAGTIPRTNGVRPSESLPAAPSVEEHRA